MVDFRKWLFALAAAAPLFLGLGSTAQAQTSGAFVCQATAGNPNIVRSEGVAELVGDLVLNCTGGAVTAVGLPIPLSTVQISLNTNVTSRLTGASGSFDTEAILALDEPGTTVPGSAPELGCIADGLHACGILSSGAALNFGAAGPYNGTAGHPNLFQGVANGGANQINWQGVPIDAPGTTGTRIIRITNVRANACMLGVGSSLVPTTITELIGISGGETIIINQPLQTVALVEKGLTSSVGSGTTSFQQCNNLNAFLLSGSGGNGSADSPYFITLTATEGFGAAFKPVAYIQPGPPAVYAQPVLGTSYNTESGFTTTATGLDQSGRLIGYADTATQIQFTITGIPSGVQIFVPATVPLVGPGGSVASDGGSPASPVWTGTTASTQPVYSGIAACTGSGSTTDICSTASLVTSSTSTFDLNPPSTTPVGTGTFSGFTQITPSGTTATVTYQINAANSSIVESLIVPVEIAYITSSSTVPLPGSVSATANFAPLAASTAQGVAGGPIPRFCQPYGPSSVFTITPCTCNLLFPFVTNQDGFDTGIAIANTSADPYGTAPQTGIVNLWYYGTTSGGGAAPPMAPSQPIPAGQELVFLVSSGGNFGIPATPNFQGYMIAQAQFQFCHGFAFISDLGAQKLAEGYLAISLDTPAYGLRGAPGSAFSTSFGENMGH